MMPYEIIGQERVIGLIEHFFKSALCNRVKI